MHTPVSAPDFENKIYVSTPAREGREGRRPPPLTLYHLFGCNFPLAPLLQKQVLRGGVIDTQPTNCHIGRTDGREKLSVERLLHNNPINLLSLCRRRGDAGVNQVTRPCGRGSEVGREHVRKEVGYRDASFG